MSQKTYPLQDLWDDFIGDDVTRDGTVREKRKGRENNWKLIKNNKYNDNDNQMTDRVTWHSRYSHRLYIIVNYNIQIIDGLTDGNIARTYLNYKNLIYLLNLYKHHTEESYYVGKSCRLLEDGMFLL